MLEGVTIMDAAATQSVIAWESHKGSRVASAGEFDVIECAMCGFRHVVPLPSPVSLQDAYRDAYYRDEKPTFLAHATEDQDWAELTHIDRLELFERLLGPHRRRLLDIGCGPGFFLRSAKTRGWRALGIEPSRQAAAHARGLGVEVAEGFFDEKSAPGLGVFDAVHLNNVLEHLPDPVGVLALARDLLADGGILCVNVPNDFSPLQIAAAAQTRKQWWIAPPHHLNYFDFDSLTGVLENLGLTVAERTTSFPMEAFLLMGEDYVRDPALGRGCHNRRKRFDLALEAAGLREARRAFYRALADVGMGREAVIVAIKP